MVEGVGKAVEGGDDMLHVHLLNEREFGHTAKPARETYCPTSRDLGSHV